MMVKNLYYCKFAKMPFLLKLQNTKLLCVHICFMVYLNPFENYELHLQKQETDT